MAGEQVPRMRVRYGILHASPSLFSYFLHYFHRMPWLTHRRIEDIPAHTYQASFEPNKEWSTFYAAAPEIHQYWKRVVAKYGCMKYVKLQHQVTEAAWDDEKKKWQLKVGNQFRIRVICIGLLTFGQIQDLASGTVHPDQCDVLISATGALNNWKWPNIPGLHDFKGKLMHSACWDESYDYTVRSFCST